MVKLLFNLSLLLFLLCSIINAETYVAMYGNPGSGKSTLLSCLTNTPGNFPSGLSKVTGLTKEFIEKKYGDVVYIDTPGLADIYNRDNSVLKIEESLKKNENYKLIFVIQPTAGRINPDDLETINTILQSISEKIPFGIIYNKLSKYIIKEFTNDPNYLGELHNKLLKREPHSYLLLERLDELDDQDNAIAENVAFINDLRNYVDRLPSTFIPKEKVVPLPESNENQLKVIQENYKRQQEEHQKEVARLREEYNNSCIRYETQSEDRSTPFERQIGSKTKIIWKKFKKVKIIFIEKGDKIDKYIRTNCIKGSGDIQYGEWIYVDSREVVTSTESRKK